MTFDQALKKAKSINNLAKLLGVTRQAVQDYKRRGTIPESRVLQLKEGLAAQKAAK
jgi:predicted transcriptional regulator